MIKDILKNADERMSRAIEHVRQEFVKIRTGKASVGLLDGIKADYYGTPTPLNQLGNISTPDYHTITIQPYDKSVIQSIDLIVESGVLLINCIGYSSQNI